MGQQKETWVVAVRRQLLAERGNLRVVAEQSGVPYPTITKITSGAVTNPRVDTVQTLFDYFAGLPEQTASANCGRPAH